MWTTGAGALPTESIKVLLACHRLIKDPLMNAGGLMSEVVAWLLGLLFKFTLFVKNGAWGITWQEWIVGLATASILFAVSVVREELVDQ